MLTLRKHKISRLEEFSDAVFGFALTLLVITSSVPRSYEDLIALVRGIPAFACCFALLIWVWNDHDGLFERYPLNDGITVVLNSALLFFVLLYGYSLKFMFDAPRLVFIAPMGFALRGPVHWWFGNAVERRRQALEAAAVRNRAQVN
ncbi:MAG: TMEM175 family protein [Acidobacteriota bacterium]|nr:DUF1211 domain-containing protein [Acidobacteriota bacterium]MDQ3417929.1 TMEM175 family protein [Acidobacteriota bacterium]